MSWLQGRSRSSPLPRALKTACRAVIWHRRSSLLMLPPTQPPPWPLRPRLCGRLGCPQLRQRHVLQPGRNQLPLGLSLCGEYRVDLPDFTADKFSHDIIHGLDGSLVGKSAVHPLAA